MVTPMDVGSKKQILFSAAPPYASLAADVDLSEVVYIS